MANKIVIRSYSKIIFTLPTLLLSATGWLIQVFFRTPLAWFDALWFVFFFANLLVVAFDFSLQKVIIIVLLSIILGFLAWIFLVPCVSFLIEGKTLKLGFSSHYYILMSLIFGTLIIIAFLSPLFDYYVIERNEIYHRKGMFTMAERYPTAGMSFIKEIPDMFEYLIFRAGILTFYPTSSSKDSIRLTTVLNINKKEKNLDYLLSRIKVEQEPER